MPWNQVESVNTDAPLYVSVRGGEAIRGALSVSEGRAEFGGRSVPVADVSVIRNAAEQSVYERRLAPGWGELWTGSAALGWAGTAGNARTQTFTTGVNAARTTNSDKVSLYFNTVNASATVNGINSGTAKAVRGGVGYDRNITSRLFVNLFNDYEYDKFQNLDLRFVLGGGLGFNLIKNDTARFDLLGGLAYNRETFATPLTRNSAEFYWGDDYSLKLNSFSSLVQGFRMFSNLSELGDYRINFDLGLSTRLNSRVTWNVNLSDRYLNNPAPGRKTNDLLYSTGLGITLSN
jgi:putative salt-induced outer membrane protein YdiY